MGSIVTQTALVKGEGLFCCCVTELPLIGLHNLPPARFSSGKTNLQASMPRQLHLGEERCMLRGETHETSEITLNNLVSSHLYLHLSQGKERRLLCITGCMQGNTLMDKEACFLLFA